MLQINQLAMQHDNTLLFDDVDLILHPGKRYGLVGANGAGKTTLMKIISGDEQPTLGEVSYPKQTRLGVLKQDHYQYENERIIDVVIRGKAALWAALSEKDAIYSSDELDDAAGYRLGELEEIILHEDGYSAESFAQTLLLGVGIPAESHFATLSTLSGGNKLRVLLAQVLFSSPDIMLLDEPTNHLDIMSIKWLEDYLKNKFNGVLIFISHDQDFLNNLATHILDIDYGEIELYHGNYDKFVAQKQLSAEQKEQELLSNKRTVDRLQKFVDRFKAKASKAKQAQSRQKQINKIALPDIKSTSRIKPNFNFDIVRNSGKTVIKIEGISKAYAEKAILNNVKFTIKRGEKIAIIGHNGIGKSTLLKIILDKVESDSGEFEWGHETHIDYFPQSFHEEFNTEGDLIAWLSEQAPQAQTSDVRKTLGNVLFTKTDQEKQVAKLSGGELARLLLAKFMLLKGNVLILDEPTNHLDIEAIDALAAALKAYPGTVIMVSHNRHFVAKLANRIIALTETGIHDFPGRYRDYLAKVGDDYLNREWLKTQEK